MVKILDRDRRTLDGLQLCVFLIDSEEDIALLPTSQTETKFKRCATGSLAVMYGSGEGLMMYGLTSSDEWVEL